MINYSYETHQYHRSHRFEPITLKFNFANEVRSFKDECVNRAIEIYKHNPNAYLLLSGGVSSQLVLESYIEAGLKPKVLILKFENDLNLYDTNPAVQSCKNFGIIPLVVEICPRMIFAQQSGTLGRRYQIYNFFDCLVAYCAETLPVQMQLVDPIQLRKDIDVNQRWCWIINESDTWIKRFNRNNIKKPIINSFFTKPEVLQSFLKIPIIEELVNDNFPGKLSALSSRKQAYYEAGFVKVSSFHYTNSTYNIGWLEDKFADLFYKATLYDARKLYIPCTDLLTCGGTKSWTFI